MREYYTIQELARDLNITARTLRFYEEQGLLEPHRKGSCRHYTHRDRYQLKRILQAKRLNFSLAEIASLLAIYSNAPKDASSLNNAIAMIASKRVELRQMLADIKDLNVELDRTEELCYERMVELRLSQ